MVALIRLVVNEFVTGAAVIVLRYRWTAIEAIGGSQY
jgi:hypothetical protein